MRGPVVAKCGYLETICFYENDDSLIQFNPEMRFWGRNLDPVSFHVEEWLELPGGIRFIEGVQSLDIKEVETLQSELREAIKQANCIQTAKVVSGYRYKLRSRVFQIE